MPKNSFEIIKVFNNNVVLVMDNKNEKILCSKGIGFGKKCGDFIDGEVSIEKVFVIEDKSNMNRFNELSLNLEPSVIGMCEEIISMISKELDEPLNENIHIALTDHISFTLKRLKENDEITNPFLIETQTLFKNEFQIALKAVDMIKKHTGIEVPEGEAGFIALHIHSARHKEGLSNSIKYVFIANSVVEVIEDELEVEFDKESLDYARFIIHLRFAVERIIKKAPISNELLASIKRKFKSSYKIAEKAARIIEEDLGEKVVEDEVGYIAMHIERLKTAIKK